MSSSRFSLLALFLAHILNACNSPAADHQQSEDRTLQIDGVVFESGNWAPHLDAGDAGVSLGNHRAEVVVEPVTSATELLAVRAHIPWRRSDPRPEDKRVFVIDAVAGDTVQNVVLVRADNESGDIVFQPNKASSAYYVYYLPYETGGGYYPRLSHLSPSNTAETDWLEAVGPLTEDAIEQLPVAKTTRIQSINDFHSFVPMEIIATSDEVSNLLSGTDQAFYLFPEDRTRSIRMQTFLPKRWADRGLVDVFEGKARRGEYYTFQIGVYAQTQNLENVVVSFGDFQQTAGVSIASTEFTCFNTSGIDQFGKPFSKVVSVDEGHILPLWIGVQIPEDAKVGSYTGIVRVSTDRAPDLGVSVTIDVTREASINRGDNDPTLMTRLRWLNSTIGTNPDFVMEPYTPVVVEHHSIGILGRSITLGDNGLPSSIKSYFSPEMTGFSNEPEDIIAQPMTLLVHRAETVESWSSEPFIIEKVAQGRATWTARSESDNFFLTVDGAIEYEGMVDVKMTLVARGDVALSDISFPIAYHPDASSYILGLGYPGQSRPESIDWKWEVEKHQEGLWLGGINKGLQYVLRDENYVRPLNTNFYQTQPLNMPASWHNGGRGGIKLTSTPAGIVAQNYSGPRHILAGDTLHFNIRFLITPFKPLDTTTHFKTRFVHKYVPVDSVITLGGTVVNIHHANEINPYINYPFFNLDLQTDYIEEAHDKNVKVKLYNTIRELTYRSHELFALRSLGDEILNDGEGGGHSWLQEHLIDGYHSAWHAYRVDDAAILNKGTSRWTNYYIEGLNWLAEYQNIDGLYLDDIAFSRETVKRMISVLHQHRSEVVIDLHSANQFNPRDGFINSAMLYMEHFPFISRLWFGEYFDYDAEPDYWLTEVSGLPFGLMGEMLQDCGKPYRGMLYGMTTRMYGECDPGPVWNMMNDFQIEESRMLGYWLDSTPARADHPQILVTTYVRPDSVLLAVASWSESDEEISLTVDWDQLGLDPSMVVASILGVGDLQGFAEIDPSGPIRVDAEQGLFILLRQ